MIGAYSHKRIWKIGLFSIAVLIGVSSVVYTNFVIKQLAVEESERIQLMAKATKLLAETDEPQSLNFYLSIIRGNTNIPVIITDSSGNITTHRNLDSTKANDTTYLRKMLEEFADENEPIQLNSEFMSDMLYYGDSTIVKMLRFYPYAQLMIISLFIFVSYLAFSSSRKFEQNQVWVGMSKETAHQLGTPLSSLMAWVEYLKDYKEPITNDIVSEIDKDVKRLEVITERFSKVGSQPKLEKQVLSGIIINSIEYLQKRVSAKVEIKLDESSDLEASVYVSPSLFEWVIENLCKNAVDAMDGEGSITFLIQEKGNQVWLDVKDTGKGVPIYLQKTIFNPGYTTRKRGWGLGLSLSKRIIDFYHKGFIYVHHSDEKGTTFRIKLNAEDPTD